MLEGLLPPESLLRKSKAVANPGSLGQEVGWYDLGVLSLRGALLISDASFIPAPEDGLVVSLPEGGYQVSFAVIDYGLDWRVSRLRVAAPEATGLGILIGRTWTDTGRTGVCDLGVLRSLWGSDWEASYGKVAPWFDSELPFGVAEFDPTAGAIIPFVESGFGDGNFPVHELTSPGGSRAGVEVRFVAAGRRYPKFPASR